jgi:hypothetical protein
VFVDDVALVRVERNREDAAFAQTDQLVARGGACTRA